MGDPEGNFATGFHQRNFATDRILTKDCYFDFDNLACIITNPSAAEANSLTWASWNLVHLHIRSQNLTTT